MVLWFDVLLWRGIGGGGGCFGVVGRWVVVEDREGEVVVRSAWCGGLLKERVRCSWRVVVDDFRSVRLDCFGLRNGLFCGRSECERLLEVAETCWRPLPCRKGGVPVVASPLGPDHASQVGRLAVWVRHCWRGGLVMERDVRRIEWEQLRGSR